MRLKDISILSPRYNGPRTEALVAFVPMEGLRSDRIEQQEITIEEGSGKYTYFADNDLLIAKVTPCFENGNIAVAKELRGGIGFGSSEIFVLRFNKESNPRYMYYVAQSSEFQRQACATMCGVGGLKRISPLFMRTYEFDVPSKEEQDSITSYLDNQFEQINKRICLRERELQTLIKLKQSVVNDALRAGLSSSTQYKDSGISWMTAIPESWKVLRFKELFPSWSKGITPESKNGKFFEVDDGYTWVTIGDLNGKYVSESALNLSETAVRLFDPIMTRKGSLLFSFKLSIGKVAFADKDLFTNEAIVSIPANEKKYHLNFFYYLLPFVLVENATENIYGAKMLNQKIISNMLFPVPPIEEQKAIADYLDAKMSNIDNCISNINAQIDKLKQLKKSLINEVISGQRPVI